MGAEKTRSTIISFFDKVLPGRRVADDDDIFSLGFINSLMAMQLVLFVEKEFGFPVTNDDLDIANFRSISAICGLVERKLGNNQ